MHFDVNQFLVPLDLSVLIMAVILGFVMGLVITNSIGVNRFSLGHLWWETSMGIVFFIPLSILRAFQGSTVWERFAATLVLWFVFVLGTYVGSLVAIRVLWWRKRRPTSAPSPDPGVESAATSSDTHQAHDPQSTHTSPPASPPPH